MYTDISRNHNFTIADIGIEIEIEIEAEAEVEVEVNLLGIHVEVDLNLDLELGTILIGVFPTYNVNNVDGYIVAMKQSINAKYPSFLTALYLPFGQLDQQKELIILLGFYLFSVCDWR
uniref:AlNc14C382G11231 protein n=1 Tax=Albugo laibachii Nc14 TaxID=890382 RepID=F0WYH0_9STRA|nr:AlNc14C382G11231 [Albugo laibachii Nc14]|eukprot:CCA26525.1 AlNc14C382G11231 [Albugo laibachii Nc14]